MSRLKSLLTGIEDLVGLYAVGFFTNQELLLVRAILCVFLAVCIMYIAYLRTFTSI